MEDQSKSVSQMTQEKIKNEKYKRKSYDKEDNIPMVQSQKDKRGEEFNRHKETIEKS